MPEDASSQKVAQAELRPWQHGAIFLLACAVIISRRPDAVFNAQFWAEDGPIFFADALNLGWWSALFHPYLGYVHIFPRLGASLALLVPLSSAPLVLNLLAIVVQALPVNILLSARSSAFGSLRFRAFMAGMLLALPNCSEVNATITNSQWFLALSVILLLVASRPLGKGERAFDFLVLSFCALSGPFCIFLLPIALFLARKDRDRWRWVEVGVLGVGCFVQTLSLLSGGYSSRWHYPLGASPTMFARLLAGQVFLGTLFGGISQDASVGRGYVIGLIVIAVGGTILVTVCFLKAPLAMKLFLLFCSMVVASTLTSATFGPATGDTAWGLLARGFGSRYWFFPTLAFGWTLLWCFQSRIRALKIVSAVLLYIMSFTIALRWRHPPLRDTHFADYVSRFEAAPPGTVVIIPGNPTGWNLRLVKHAQQ